MLLTLGCFSLASASCSRGAESLLAFLLKMLSERSRYTVSQSQPPWPQSDPACSPHTPPSLCPLLCPRTTAPLVSHGRSKVLVLPCGTCWEWRATSCASVAVTFLLYLLQNPIAVYCPPIHPSFIRHTLWIPVVMFPFKFWSSCMWISEILAK